MTKDDLLVFGAALIIGYPLAWWWFGSTASFVSFALGAPAGMLFGWWLSMRFIPWLLRRRRGHG